MIALLLLHSAVSITYVVSDFCPCDVTSAADVGCSCDPQNANTSTETYPIRREDFLPRCPATPLKSKLPLGQWLRDEIFCLRNDKRSTRPKTILGDTFTLSYSVPRISISSDSSSTSNVYAYGDSILTTAGTPLLLPGSSTSGSCDPSSLSIQFLRDISQEVCFLPNESDSFTTAAIRTALADGIRATPNETTSVQFDVVGADGVARDLAVTFLFNRTSYAITSATVTVTPYAADATPTTLAVRVYFRADDADLLPKSGNAGYSQGQPVIAARNLSNFGLAVSRDERGSFPLPFGAACGSAAYTPLLFGIDTIAGCTGSGTNAVDLSAYTHVAIYGIANVSRASDWVEITNACTDPDPPLQKFYFYYEKFGDVLNAQNRIVSVYRTCNETSGSTNERIVVATFLQRQQRTFRYKPPNPKVPGLPDDTFAPFA